MRVTLALAVAAALGLPHIQLHAQAPPTAATVPAAFDVASVKPNNSGAGFVNIALQPGGRFTATNFPLRDLIRIVYGVQSFQVVGGPDWIRSQRFDIVAKAPDGVTLPPPGLPAPGPTSRNPMFVMLQALLADRFKLKTHNETRDLPIYALVLARSDGKLGAQIRPAAADCAALAAARGRAGTPGPPAPPAPGERLTCGMRVGPGQISAGGVPLSQLAASLSQMVQRVVIDRSEVTGNYDIDLTYTPEQLPPRGPGTAADQPIRINGVDIDPNGPSIFTAVQEQLGLKLNSQRGPVDVVIIDSVEEPTPD